MTTARGALIVFEGCDRSGKSTQCKRLVNALLDSGKKAMYMNFPDRKTECGALINSFLTNSQEFNDETIHLLFTINRWEAKKKMENLLKLGTTLIVDRYSYSGVAFSAAKGLDVDWCKAPEKGLLKPDCVLFLTLPIEAIAKRGGFGNERYEVSELQTKANANFQKLFDGEYWIKVNADTTEDLLHTSLLDITQNIIKDSGTKPIKLLW